MGSTTSRPRRQLKLKLRLEPKLKLELAHSLVLELGLGLELKLALQLGKSRPVLASRRGKHAGSPGASTLRYVRRWRSRLRWRGNGGAEGALETGKQGQTRRPSLAAARWLASESRAWGGGRHEGASRAGPSATRLSPPLARGRATVRPATLACRLHSTLPPIWSSARASQSGRLLCSWPPGHPDHMATCENAITRANPRPWRVPGSRRSLHSAALRRRH